MYRLNHFAPTELAKQNLFAEGVMSDEIHVTGNTIVDSLRFMIAKIADDRELQLRIAERFPILTPGRKLVLVTGHRRESFGPGFEQICQALRRIAERGDAELVYPLRFKHWITTVFRLFRHPGLYLSLAPNLKRPFASSRIRRRDPPSDPRCLRGRRKSARRDLADSTPSRCDNSGNRRE